MPARRRTSHRRRRAKQIAMPFPLASPTEGTYREPQYQARIEMYAQNHFTPAEYNKIKSRGISFVRGDADMIRHAFIGEPGLRHKVQEFTGSAYVYDLAHALLLQVKRTVQQLVNVPEGLDTQTLLAVLYNLKGFEITDGPAGLPAGTQGTNPDASVQLTALSSTDLESLQGGTVTIKGKVYAAERVPAAGSPKDSYPWSLTANRQVAVDCVVAHLLEVCRQRKIRTEWFSLVQRSGVFQPLDLDESGNRADMGSWGELDAYNTFGYNPHTGSSAGLSRQQQKWPTDRTDAALAYTGGKNGEFDNILRSIQLPAGQSFGPTSVAGLDEVFRMEQERDSIIAILTQWGTTGLGLILGGQVDYATYRTAADTTAPGFMGNKPAYSKFAEINGMGDSCGPGNERVWFTGDPTNEKSRSVPGHIFVNGMQYKNPQATHAVCAPMTRQLRSMPYSRDVVTNPRLGVAMQRRIKRRRPARKTTTRRRNTTRRRR